MRSYWLLWHVPQKLSFRFRLWIPLTWYQNRPTTFFLEKNVEEVDRRQPERKLWISTVTKTAIQTRTLSLLVFSYYKCFLLSTADCIIAYVDTTLCDCTSMSYRRQITCRQPEIHGGEDCPKHCYTGQLIAGSKSCSWDDLDTFKCAASRGKPFNIMFSLIFTTALMYICSRDPWFKRFQFTVACSV